MKIIVIAAVLVAATGAAWAGTTGPPPTSSSLTETRAFAGLNWTFGKGKSSAEGVLGVARIKTKTDGGSSGAKLSLHYKLKDLPNRLRVKLTGMTGTDDLMAEAGIGAGQGGIFGTAGLWAPYVNAGGDLYFNGDFEGYVGLHTLRGPDRPAAVILAR